MRLGRARKKKGRALQVGVRLGRVCGRKEGALRVGVRLGKVRKRPKRARKSNTAPLAIERSILQTLASFSRIIHTGNGIKGQIGPGI